MLPFTVAEGYFVALFYLLRVTLILWFLCLAATSLQSQPCHQVAIYCVTLRNCFLMRIEVMVNYEPTPLPYAMTLT